MSLNIPPIDPLSNMHRPALIIGNGPSVDALNPALLGQFETFGCNHIGRRFAAWGRPTDNVVVTDHNRICEIGDLYKDYRGSLYIGDGRYGFPPVRRIRRTVGRDFIPLRQLKKATLDRFTWLDHFWWPKLLYSSVFHKSRFSFSMEKGLNFGHSVVISAIQLAAIKGHKTILLTGVDSHYRTPKDYFQGMAGDINFVNPDFIAAPRLFMEPLLVLLQIHFEQMGVLLVDCTPNGALRFITKGRFTDHPPHFQVTNET